MNKPLIDLLILLLPLAIGGAVQPPQIIAGILLLLPERGLINSLAWLASMTIWRLLQGWLLWVVFAGAEATLEDSGGRFSILVGAILFILGIVFLAYAARQATGGRGSDQDVQQGAWLKAIQNVTPYKAALLGLAFLAFDPKDWLLTVAVINVIANADLSAGLSLAMYVFYVILVESVVIAPVIMRILLPQRSLVLLGSINAWLEHNDRSIEVITSILMGLIFLLAGLSQMG